MKMVAGQELKSFKIYTGTADRYNSHVGLIIRFTKVAKFFLSDPRDCYIYRPRSSSLGHKAMNDKTTVFSTVSCIIYCIIYISFQCCLQTVLLLQ